MTRPVGYLGSRLGEEVGRPKNLLQRDWRVSLTILLGFVNN